MKQLLHPPPLLERSERDGRFEQQTRVQLLGAVGDAGEDIGSCSGAAFLDFFKKVGRRAGEAAVVRVAPGLDVTILCCVKRRRRTGEDATMRQWAAWQPLQQGAAGRRPQLAAASSRAPCNTCRWCHGGKGGQEEKLR